MNKNFHEDENGFLVITSSDTSSTKRHVPLECPICGFLMRDNTDDETQETTDESQINHKYKQSYDFKTIFPVKLTRWLKF